MNKASVEVEVRGEEREEGGRGKEIPASAVSGLCLKVIDTITAFLILHLMRLQQGTGYGCDFRMVMGAL